MLNMNKNYVKEMKELQKLIKNKRQIDLLFLVDCSSLKMATYLDYIQKYISEYIAKINESVNS